MEASSTSSLLSEGRYATLLLLPQATPLIQHCFESFVLGLSETTETRSSVASNLDIAAAALNAFLQVNVTGPVLVDQASIEHCFLTAFRVATNDNTASLRGLRTKCLEALTIDGVAPYGYIPLLEVFAFSRYVFLTALKLHGAEGDPKIGADLRWKCLRLHVWHYKLLAQPSLGGTAFAKAAQWCDIPSLQETIIAETEKVENIVLAEGSSWGIEEKVEFLLEKAAALVILGLDSAAKTTIEQATALHGFVYSLSGALGKRTKWQGENTSQLVVLAKSGAVPTTTLSRPKNETKPESLLLNDDTLLEQIEFSKAQISPPQDSVLPKALDELVAKPDEQPQLTALDQIILLTDATIKDSFSPADTLTAEEVLPFASRVIAEKSTNWQIYTHALLVRSRIEAHRSRTVERGVLQMQAVVDQVVADTTSGQRPGKPEGSDLGVIPSISVSNSDAIPSKRPPTQPTSFLPAPKSSESAPPQDRLRYVHALFSPPKWHLESELAYGWAGVGSLVSALEIFKRLRLWAEVALCLASAGAFAAKDEDGRGSGGEEKARAILRWQLYRPTEMSDGSEGASIDDDVDVDDLKAADFMGAERVPLPPNAPRLFCILGEVESDPEHFKRSWEVSKHRFARAQKALGELYLQQRDWMSARAAYQLAVGVNRLSPELWGRLGDINLRLGRFGDAAEAFSRGIGAASDVIGGEDARTWSNLGSALWSLCCEVMEKREAKTKAAHNNEGGLEDGTIDVEEEDKPDGPAATSPNDLLFDRDPARLLIQSLAAYKRGAKIANTNWRIWDNVITLASRMLPTPAYMDMIQAMRHVLRIRNTEAAIDVDVLRTLLQDLVLFKEPLEKNGKYNPPRGTKEKAVIDLLEDVIVPLITIRDDLWELVCKERVWRRDYSGAVEASEKAWRTAMAPGAAGVGLGASLGVPANGANSNPDEAKMKPRGPWTEDAESWENVVHRTDELVSMLENYGSIVETIGTRWRGKARMAVRSVMGKGKERWEGTEGWKILEGVQEGLK